MYAVVTDEPAAARGGPWDRVEGTVDAPNGDRRPARDGCVAVRSCWGDTETTREEPDRAAVTADGTRATPAAEDHHWGSVCPTDPAYRARVLERLERADAGDVRLTTVGFPEAGFCRCERCDHQFAASDASDRESWRAGVVTAFVADAADRVAGDLTVTLHPDPYPGALRERFGVDPHALAPFVDGFHVPLCAASYETAYWVETVARGFARELEATDASLAVQLAAGSADPDRLATLARRLEPHVDAVAFGARGSELEVVRETIDRVRAAGVAVPGQ